MKKIQKLFIVLVLMLSFQFNLISVKAAEVTLRFFELTEQIFTGTQSSVVKHTEGLEKIKDVKNFSYVTRYKTNSRNGSEYHSLFFVGNKIAKDNYVNIYVKPVQGNGSRLGVELRNTENKHYYVDTDTKLNDGQYHSIAFTIEEGVGYVFYIDGEMVKVNNELKTRFIAESVSNPTYFSFGGGDRPRGGNNYLANATLKNTRLYIETLSPKKVAEEHFNDTLGGAPLFVKRNVSSQTGRLSDNVSLSNTITSFTINATFRHENQEKFDLFTLNNGVLSAYINPINNKAGLRYNNIDKEISLPNGLLSQDKWHSIAYVVDKGENTLSIYVDRELVGTVTEVVGLNELGDLSSTLISSSLKGHIERIYLFGHAISQDGVNTLHAPTNYTFEKMVDKTNSYESETINLFEDGYAGSRKYRIPSLLTTNKGTLLAAIDKRHQHHLDWGNIDTFLRRSTDGGKNWDEGKTIIDLVDNESAGDQHSAFLIDPSMVQDAKTGHIFMLVDMFPESRGFFTVGQSEPGDDSVTVEGRKYQRLKDVYNVEYYIKDDGKVYKKEDNSLTNYTVTVKAEAPYRALGDLYLDGKKVGNVMMKGSPLRMQSTARLWLTHSEDDGETWKQPVDITSQVKAEWMKFIGTGPGVGIQLKNGRLVFPIYYTNTYGKQSSAVIYSDDNGKTWKRGESPNDGRSGYLHSKTITQNHYEITESQVVQLNNGDLKLFMRNNYYGSKLLVATSKDNGETWENNLEVFNDILEPYCQLSVIHYGEKDGKELIIFSNPSNVRGNRSNGTLRIGEVNDGNITFTHSQVLEKGEYAYSSITKLPNGNIGILYEAANLDIRYREVDLNWIKASLVNKPAEAPVLQSVTDKSIESKLEIGLNFDKRVLVSGDVELELNINGVPTKARYVDGSGTNNLIFEYPIKGDEEGALILKGITGITEGVYKHKAIVQEKVVHDFDVIPQSLYKVTTNNNEPSEPAQYAIDGDTSTLWHSLWNKGGEKPHTLTIELDKVYRINRFVYVPRQSGGDNGIITEYRIEVSEDGKSYTEATRGVLPKNNTIKEIKFDAIDAKYVKFISISGHNDFSSAAEIYIKKYSELIGDKTTLIESYEKMKSVEKGNYTKDSFDAFTQALEFAKEIIDLEKASKELVEEATELLQEMFNELKEREINEQSEKGVKAKFLSETFEDDDVTLSVEKKQGNNIRDSYEISFTKDGNKVQPVNNQVVEVTLPRKSDQEVVKIEHDHEGTIEEITDFTLGEGTITFNTSKFSGFTIVYRPPVLALTELDKGVEKFNSLSKADYEEVGYNALKSKLDEINIKLKDVANPLNQTELDALVAELQSMFDALVKKENKPVEKADETTAKPDTKSEVKPSDTTQSTATIKPVAKANETIAKSDIKSEVKPSDTPAKDDAKADVDTGDSTNVLASLTALLISAMAILALRKKMK